MCIRRTRLVTAASFFFPAGVLLAQPASAGLTISSGQTANVACSGDVCSPTASHAVLNVGELENLLASGNVTVTTTGSGIEAVDLVVKGGLAWTTNSILTLDAYRSVQIERHISVNGVSGITLLTDDGGSGGSLDFPDKGSIAFANLSSSLTIDGHAFTLVGDLATLANDVAANPSGNYALANSYDAGRDGTYSSAPVQTDFTGIFEGLGNHIRHLKIKSPTDEDVALFRYMDAPGQLRDLGLDDVNVTGPSHGAAAALVAESYGAISGSYATGKLSVGDYGTAGGLVAEQSGPITKSHTGVLVSAGTDGYVGGFVGMLHSSSSVTDCYSTGQVSSAGGSAVGGFAGFINGTLSRSFATGAVMGAANDSDGGLVGNNSGLITRSYATGAVSGGSGASVGGLIGGTGSPTWQSYSTGQVSGGTYTGGLVGYDNYSWGFKHSYWDTDTSGISNPAQGAGNIANDHGIKGVSTAQFQSGLPKGFSAGTWVENAAINNGLPYLRSNPPPD